MTAQGDFDAALVQAFRREEPDSAERLLDRWGDQVYRLAICITGRTEDAEGVVRRALRTAAREAHTFVDDAAFGRWLCRITAKAAYQRLRARPQWRQELLLTELLPPRDGDARHFDPMDDWSPRVDRAGLQGNFQEVLTTALEGLPADYRTAFVMHDVEGLSNPEIAKTLEIALPAVKSCIHRSRLLLRQRLAEYMSEASEQSSS